MSQPDTTAPGAYTVIETVRGERTYLTPPDYVNDEAINLTENSRKVLERRYLRRDLDGSLLETPAGMFYRVAYHVAAGGRATRRRPRAGRATSFMTSSRNIASSPTAPPSRARARR